MGPRERGAARRRGRHKLDAMRRRATRLRERVVVTAIVGFVLLWTVVFVQMATGNDPVLGAGKAARRPVPKVAASDPERPRPQAVPPDGETGEAEATETERIELERLEAEEAEARELEEIELEEAEAEELEAVTSGQS
jgi:hypothetical protein